MITLKSNGVLGIGIEPFHNVAANLTQLHFPPGSIAFADLAPTLQMIELVTGLTERGHVIHYFDHHLETANPQNVENLRSLLGDRLVITTRSESPSCVHLIKPGLWSELDITTVFHDLDLDGFLSQVQGLGIGYPEILKDADYLDGPRSDGQSLSETGRLIINIISALTPHYFFDPDKYLATKKKLFKKIITWLSQGMSEPLLNKVEKDQLEDKLKEGRILAEHLAKNNHTEFLPGGIAVANFVNQLAMGRKPDVAIWKRNVSDRSFAEGREVVIFCRRVVGHLGIQFCIEPATRFQNEIDLRNFMPDGSTGHEPFRLHVPENKWEEFLANWRATSEATIGLAS
jgi:hypothetical protein